MPSMPSITIIPQDHQLPIISPFMVHYTGPAESPSWPPTITTTRGLPSPALTTQLLTHHADTLRAAIATTPENQP